MDRSTDCFESDLLTLVTATLDAVVASCPARRPPPDRADVVADRIERAERQSRAGSDRPNHPAVALAEAGHFPRSRAASVVACRRRRAAVPLRPWGPRGSPRCGIRSAVIGSLQPQHGGTGYASGAQIGEGLVGTVECIFRCRDGNPMAACKSQERAGVISGV